MKPTTLVLLLLISVALAACGDAGPATTAVTRTSATPAAVAPRSARDGVEADRFAARAALLRLSDFPAGWTVEPNDDGADLHCPATDRIERNPKAETDRFDLAHVHSLSQEVVVLRSAKAADAAIDALIARETLACIARQIETTTRRGVRPGIRVGRLTFARLPAAAAGDRSEGSRLTIPVSAGGVSTHVYGDFAFTRVGRGVSMMALLSQRLPADGLRTQLVARAAERLAEALAAGKT